MPDAVVLIAPIVSGDDLIAASLAFAMLGPALAEPLPVQKPPALAVHHARTAITPRARSACHFAAHKMRSPSRQTGAVRSAGRRPIHRVIELASALLSFSAVPRREGFSELDAGRGGAYRANRLWG